MYVVKLERQRVNPICVTFVFLATNHAMVEAVLAKQASSALQIKFFSFRRNLSCTRILLSRENPLSRMPPATSSSSSRREKTFLTKTTMSKQPLRLLGTALSNRQLPPWQQQLR